jgi:hypothetical protein
MGYGPVTDWDPQASALRVAESERLCLMKYLWALIKHLGGEVELSDAELAAVPANFSLDAGEDPFSHAVYLAACVDVNETDEERA